MAGTDSTQHRVPRSADGDQRAAIRRVLAQTPDERLEGLRLAAAFFASARRA